MATLTIPNSFNNGEVIDAPEMNANFTAVKTFVEGMSQGDNFDPGAINTADIADSAIIEAKIATAAVTTSKLGSSLTLTTPNIGVATGTSLNATGNVIGHLGVSAQVGSYTLALTDDGTIVRMNAGSANNLTIPPDSSVNFTIGSQIIIYQIGAGQTTIVAGSGVTVNGTPGLKLRAQYSVAVCVKIAADLWAVFGDLSA